MRRSVDGRYDKPELEIPYYGIDGEKITVRRRVALSGKRHTLSEKGAQQCLYGLDRLAEAKAAGYVIIVEGESDTQTFT